MAGTIPVSAIIITRNEARRINRCINALKDFNEIVIVDSASSDETPAIARAAGATVVPFEWDGCYPKKKQWCLDNLTLKNEWVFLVDADEELTTALKAEIASLFAAKTPACGGYFVPGLYVMNGGTLRFGLRNKKLALFDRRLVAFPVVDDLDLPGMGEVEGHYQPVAKSGHVALGALKHGMLHHAYESMDGWRERHRRYAAWEAGMNARGAWPADPDGVREVMKQLFRRMPGRGAVAFAHSYLLRLGFLDGREGFVLARDRWRYYRMIAEAASRYEETGAAEP
ncbi:MAG TPA: glycosyltransferase family 2 protein [Patescibacteria group bacterium]|nr:glycosyltransferase family 2 protein [Patescibacteria group bacterium]